jgi:ferredoxin
MIKVKVDMDKCQHYGQCVFEAPNIFKLNAEDKLEYLATAEDSEKANVIAAADVCPMQAITFTEQ